MYKNTHCIAIVNMTSDLDTAFVLFMFMLSFIFVTVCGLASVYLEYDCFTVQPLQSGKLITTTFILLDLQLHVLSVSSLKL